MRFTFLIIAFITIVSGLDNGLGRTPPMGWNTWNHFQCQVNEQLLKDSADAMIELGFYEAGYKYLNLDDCWEGHRDENGYITTDPITFPGGIKALADYAHEKGLLFGIYSDAGRLTCARRLGSLGYEDKDAQRYAEWGIDFLKYDNCHNDGSPEIQRYVKMRDALNKTGRPIFYSICEWGWRTTLDIRATWASIISIIQKQQMITKYAGPGGWNDPDMLQIGNGQLTLEEQRSHFSLWAALKAPLLLGFDIRNPPVDAKAIALNEEIIAINQDPLGLSVSIVQRTRFYDIWTGPLSDGYVAVLFNRGEIPVVITLYFASHCNLEGEIAVRDLWEHADKGNFATSYFSRVPKHGVTVVKLTGGSRINKHNEPLFLQQIWDEDIVDDDPIEIDISINGDQIY